MQRADQRRERERFYDGPGQHLRSPVHHSVVGTRADSGAPAALGNEL